MCYYKLNYPEKFRGNVTFERDSNTYISIRRSKNGVFTDLSSIGRRILEGVQRNLATTDVYEILDADFIEIYYGANAELSTSIFTMTFDHTNYFQGATQTSTTSRSKPWKILVIVVSIVIFIIVIGIIIAVPSII
jgi:ABC-type multidrug transport system permease subunit